MSSREIYKVHTFRVLTRRRQERLEQMKGKLLTDRERVATLNHEGGACAVVKPDGKPLCVYLPRAVTEEITAAFPTLTKIRGISDNRGYASGSQRVDRKTGSSRTRAKEVMSSIIGSFEATGPFAYCRLTAYNARQSESFENLLPLLQRIGHLLAEYVPERYANQVREAQKTKPEWVIEGTPFTTITVNSTYPTGVHTDAGDLDAGFSTLACARKGDFRGGVLTFPEYRVGVDMQHGDLLLMDAGEWHGNTPIYCSYCDASLDRPGHTCEGMPEGVEGPERVSVVSYFRTRMVECGTMEEENERRMQVAETRTSKIFT